MSNIAADIFGNSVNAAPMQPGRTVKTGYASAQSVTVGSGATVVMRTFYPVGYQWFGAALNANVIKEANFMAPDWLIVSYRPTAAYNVVGQANLNGTGWVTLQTTGCAAAAPVVTWFPDVFADGVRFQVTDTGAAAELCSFLINTWRPR